MKTGSSKSSLSSKIFVTYSNTKYNESLVKGKQLLIILKKCYCLKKLLSEILTSKQLSNEWELLSYSYTECLLVLNLYPRCFFVVMEILILKQKSEKDVLHL